MIPPHQAAKAIHFSITRELDVACILWRFTLKLLDPFPFEAKTAHYSGVWTSGFGEMVASDRLGARCATSVPGRAATPDSGSPQRSVAASQFHVFVTSSEAFPDIERL